MMMDDRFDDLMRDAARNYRHPPAAPLDEMWGAIAARLPEREGGGGRGKGLWNNRVLQAAATLLIGVGIGRSSVLLRPGARNPGAARAVAASVSPAPPSSFHVTSSASNARVATDKYLGQTVALLIALPSEMHGGRADAQFIARAGDLLLTTRLLLDSPAASDPAIHNLLEDLELVLAQVARLQSERGRSELDLINQALEQHDVMPRLRTAVADLTAD